MNFILGLQSFTLFNFVCQWMEYNNLLICFYKKEDTLKVFRKEVGLDVFAGKEFEFCFENLQFLNRIMICFG